MTSDDTVERGVAEERERGVAEERDRAIAAQIRREVLAVNQHINDIGASLFLISALVLSLPVPVVDPDQIIAALEDLTAGAAILFPKKDHPRKKDFIGKPCPLAPTCKALVVDVGFGQGLTPVLICGAGHRTIPDPD